MTQHWISIFSLLVALVRTGWAQETVAPEEAVKEEVVKQEEKIPIDAGLGIMLDVGKLSGFFLDFETKLEAGLEYKFKNGIVLSVEGGYYELDPGAFDNGSYHSEGIVWRAGLDYSFNIDPQNIIYIGGRWGSTTFEDILEYEIGSNFWNNFQSQDIRQDLQASWAEFILGSENNIAGSFYLGVKFRLRYLIDYDPQEPIDVYSIPGYGRSFDNSVPVANLYIKYRF